MTSRSFPRICRVFLKWFHWQDMFVKSLVWRFIGGKSCISFTQAGWGTYHFWRCARKQEPLRISRRSSAKPFEQLCSWFRRGSRSEEMSYKVRQNWTFCFRTCDSVIFFLVAKLSYVMQAIHSARSNLRAFAVFFALFVWCYASEPMRRDHFLRSVKSSRLGLTHLSLSQTVSIFMILAWPKKSVPENGPTNATARFYSKLYSL